MVLRILSPVHIGSGYELKKGLDFGVKGNNVFFINQDKLFNALVEKNIPGLVEEFFDKCLNTDFFTLINQYKLKESDIVEEKPRTFIHKMKGAIKEFARDGNGLYYLPGSSIKGAIRSVYLEKRIQNKSDNDVLNFIKLTKDQKPVRTKASKRLVEDAFSTIKEKGKIANFDFFRALQFTDFYLKDENIGIIENLVLSLQFDNTLKSKEDKIFYAQAVNPGTEIPIKRLFKLDELLFKSGKMQDTLKFDLGILIEENFKKIVREYAKKTINSEIEFFKKYKNKEYTDKIISFYKNLLDRLENNKDIIIFRMSAGSGWKFMTGNIILKENRAQSHDYARNTYKLGNLRVPVFPKTRRIAITSDGKAYPMGWVEVDFSTNTVSSNSSAISTTQTNKANATKSSKEEYIRRNSTRNYKNGDKVEAEVVAFNSPNVNVKLLDNRYKDIFSFRYPVGLEIGTLVLVEVKQVSKDKVITVAFTKRL